MIEGTIKHNRNGIPKELKPVADREDRRWPFNELVFIIDSSVKGGRWRGGRGGHSKRQMKKIEISSFKKYRVLKKAFFTQKVLKKSFVKFCKILIPQNCTKKYICKILKT